MTTNLSQCGIAEVQATVEPGTAPQLNADPQAIAALATLRTSLVNAGGTVTWDNFPQEQVAALKSIFDQAAAAAVLQHGAPAQAAGPAPAAVQAPTYHPALEWGRRLECTPTPSAGRRFVSFLSMCKAARKRV